jgi:hypothetical protein
VQLAQPNPTVTPVAPSRGASSVTDRQRVTVHVASRRGGTTNAVSHPDVRARALASARALRRIVLQDVWAPVRASQLSASSDASRSNLLLAGGLILLILVLAEMAFLKLSVGLLRRTAAG